jgi:CHASE2 domain-containing sensor protein
MDKLVILKSIGGSFDQGFQCSLSIAPEGQPVDLEVLGSLPPQPTLLDAYITWQTAYRTLGLRTRISGSGTVRKGASRAHCAAAATQLKEQLDFWLRSPSFSPIRDKIQEQLQPDDRVRLILQVDNRSLQQLPWHAWELLDRYHKVEIALATPSFQGVKRAKTDTKSVRVLAILGDATGIDIKADRVFLEALPNADVTFLVEPERRALTDQLWERGWDILFFAGHSITQDGGYIYINPSEKLPISDLKYALRRSVEQGLQLAIFNSCDGFGLARNLADLHIPQTIFMREPVPDPVAQAFLKHFLMAFVTEGQSLYLAVRSARERLETSESEFLCASWLPMIFQNLAVAPQNWNELCGQRESQRELENTTPIAPSITPQSILKATAIVALSSLVSTGLVSWVRHQGWLQPMELQAYDHLMQVESKLDSQKATSPTLVITIDDDDARRYGNPNDDLSISAKNLFLLIQKLNAANAEVIAVDLIRDVKGLPTSMTDPLRKMDSLIGGCSHPSKTSLGFQAPQGLDRQVGFFDMAQDPDKSIRRNLLTFRPTEPQKPTDPCFAAYSIAVTAAAKFLGLSPKDLVAKLPILDGKYQPGGYQQPNERKSLIYPEYYGHLLIHYRGARISTLTMGDFMNDRSGKVQLNGKIVFIGITRNSSGDKHPTPLTPETLNPKTFGVMIHAEKTNHLIRLVQDREAPIWVWSERQEWGWIAGWAIVAGTVVVIGGRLQQTMVTRLLTFIIRTSSVVVVLYASCVIIWMQQSGWVPLISTVGAIVLSAAGVSQLSRVSPDRTPSEPNLLHRK